MNKILQTIKLKYKYAIEPLFLPYKDSFFEILEKGDIAVDCGANVGDVTQKMVDKGATVHAFEPNPYAFKVLTERFGNNPQVHLHNKGVWDRNSTLKLFFHSKAEEDQIHWSTGSSILSDKENVNPGSFVEIQVIDLIEFVESLNKKVKLLKIDIEGAECEVLEKMLLHNMQEKVGLTLVETHEIKNESLKPKTDAIRAKIKKQKITNINLDWG